MILLPACWKITHGGEYLYTFTRCYLLPLQGTVPYNLLHLAARKNGWFMLVRWKSKSMIGHRYLACLKLLFWAWYLFCLWLDENFSPDIIIGHVHMKRIAQKVSVIAIWRSMYSLACFCIICSQDSSFAQLRLVDCIVIM